MTTGASQQKAQKPEQAWTTANEPVTGPQRSYIETLVQDAGGDPSEVDFEHMTKGSASHYIEQLQARTGRTPQIIEGHHEAHERDSEYTHDWLDEFLEGLESD